MQQTFEAAAPQGVHQVKINLVEEAQKMLVEDIAANEAMGRHGATLMPSSGECSRTAMPALWRRAVMALRLASSGQLSIQARNCMSLPMKPAHSCKAHGLRHGS